MVRVLRQDDSAELAPAAKLADLRQLASDGGAAPSSTCRSTGDVDALPAPVAAAVYRIAQESVTNARRHARNATRIDVRVDVADERVRLTVHDDGRRARPAEPGYGITGMTERAALLGGTCTRGPRSRRRLDRHRRPADAESQRDMIRVLIADDQELVRTGLRMILDAQDDIEVVGEAVDGSEAVDLAQSLRPDVCLFDIRMPRLDGIEATRILAGPGVENPMAVVVITTFDLDEYVYAALRAGARGFLLKDAGSALLGQAIRAAADGEALIAPNVTVRLLEAFAAAAAAGAAPRRPIRTADRTRRGCRGHRRPRPQQQRDRGRAAHHPQHREDASREPDDQTRRAQPRRDRDLGARTPRTDR